MAAAAAGQAVAAASRTSPALGEAGLNGGLGGGLSDGLSDAEIDAILAVAPSPPFDANATAGRTRLVYVAAGGAATGLSLILLVGGVMAAAHMAMQCHQKCRRGARYRKAAGDVSLLPVTVEVGGVTQVLALELEGVRTLNALRGLIADAYAEVVGDEIARSSIHLEVEDEGGGFGRLEDGKPFKPTRLATAKSLYVTARPSVNSRAWDR